MRSISLRWGSENVCARARPGTTMSAMAATAAARRRGAKVIVIILPASRAGCSRRCFEARNVVGLHPAGRSDRETGLGPHGKLAGGRIIAAGKGGLRRGEIGLGDIALLAIRHGELHVAVGNVGIVGDGGAQ